MAVETADEIGLLAQTLNDMRRSIQLRDQNLQLMLSGIAHEVRNPLTGMTLFVGLLKEEQGLSQTALGHVERIDKEISSLGQVVNDFLDFARKKPLDLQVVSPEAELGQIQGLMVFDFAQANVALCIEVAPTLEKVVWDREKMRRAILNLLRNAVQASSPGTRVTLALGQQGSEWVLSVTDEGSGIERADQEKVFEPFFTTRQQGTGLGLSLVRKIVEAHAGRILLSSEPGKGTVFAIHLPIRELADS
jgi:signal transduction histidine kinase